MRKAVTVFNKAQNVSIKNSSVTVNADTSKPQEANLDRLFSEVAPNAILNADGRADEVRCYPGTREEVIDKVEKWMSGKGSRMMWLSGPAGAGKSAICQTVAERCRERGQHEANFFFFRGDGTRNRAQPLVATLVYQLRRLYPALDVPLADYLRMDPLICGASIEEQFKKLISSPIQTIQQSSSINQKIVFIIDGLDECDDKRKQEHILMALRILADTAHSPFLVLVASRAESHLVMAFNQLGASVESLFLDDEYRPEDDIRHFVIAKFQEIKSAHRLAHTLEKDWPTEGDIDAITYKSSGQFIYAATVMRFIESSHDSPALSLRIIVEMRPAAGHSPFAELDALYSYIFSKARDTQTLKLVFGAHFTKRGYGFDQPFPNLLHLVGYKALEVESSFADLAAIVQVVTGPPIQLVFYHASLSDYLLDESRSGPYHVNQSEMAVELSLICLRNFHDSDTFDITIFVLRNVEEATATLSTSLLNASARKLDENLHREGHWFLLIRTIGKLYSGNDMPVFKNILRHWVRFGYRNNIPNLSRRQIASLPPSTLKYYRRYLTTERVKFVLGFSK